MIMIMIMIMIEPIIGWCSLTQSHSKYLFKAKAVKDLTCLSFSMGAHT
jgi:hypothetical protein